VTPADVAAVEASLVSTRFLGCPTRVAPRLAAVLTRVETALHDEWTRAQLALPGGAPTQTFAAWHGVRGVGGYRKAAGWHGKGLAVDLNYQTNGYAACRSTVGAHVIHGGEAAGAGLAGVRRAFADACDRACMAYDGQPADLSARKRGESTGSAWDRWHRVSEAVRAYLAPYYLAVDALDVGEADAIPGVTVPPQVAADYQALRVPLVVGAPSMRPRTTRNPARCLMDVPRAVVVALCDVGGLRWGGVDFGTAESGDLMHWDTAARISSGAS
jgi:hypothetical protein